MSEEISHYEKQGYSYIGSTGTYLNSDYFNWYAKGIHVYLLPNKPVTVRYIDEQGNMLRNNDTLAFNLDNPNQKIMGLIRKKAGMQMVHGKSNLRKLKVIVLFVLLE